MNPGKNNIKVHLETRDDDDFMCFEFDSVLSVCLTSEDCQTELQAIFNELLSLLIKQPIKLEYIENSSFKKKLYIDVCEEYINDLNREIGSVRSKLPELLHVQVN